MTGFEELLDSFEETCRFIGGADNIPAHFQSDYCAKKQRKIDELRAALLSAIKEATHPTTAYEVVEDDGEMYYHRSMWLDKAAAEAEVAGGQLEYDDDWSTTEFGIKEWAISYPKEADHD